MSNLVDYAKNVLEDYDQELSNLCQRYPKEQTTLIVDWADVFRVDADFAYDIVDHTEQLQGAFNKAVCQTVPQQALVDTTNEDGTVERGNELSVRFKNVEDPISVTEANAGDMAASLVTIRGQITHATPVKPRLEVAAFKCDLCNDHTYAEQPTHGSNKPDGCQYECNSTLEPDMKASTWSHHQLIRVKHPPGEDDHDTHVDVHLTKDAAGVKAGNNVDVTGILRPDFGDFDVPTPEFYVEGHHIRHHQNDYEELEIDDKAEQIKEYANGEHGDPFDVLIDSVAPGIHGGDLMDSIKLALVLQLFSGWRIEKEDGTAFRGDPHVLLVGDPQTGKSQLINFIENVSPRVSVTSGANASKAGITAAAVKEEFGDSQWRIEAGAFVKAHKGICVIDELDKVQGEALSSLHSALEKQRLDVAKAGMNPTLNCETALLGACNPTEERFINPETKSLVEQIPVGEAMRSRMDSIFLLADEPDAQQDGEIVESMLKSLATSDSVDSVNDVDTTGVSGVISPDFMCLWVAYSRRHCQPDFDFELLIDRIKQAYIDMRQDSAESAAPIGARKIASIVRWSMASARARLGEKINNEDITRALNIVRTSIGQIGVTEEGQITSDAKLAKRIESSMTQEEEKNAIRDAANFSSKEEIIEETGIPKHKVEEHLDALTTKGALYEPQAGEYKST